MVCFLMLHFICFSREIRKKVYMGTSSYLGMLHNCSDRSGFCYLYIWYICTLMASLRQPQMSTVTWTYSLSRFGQVKSVRCLPEKYCAFVNFSTKEAAGKAMQGLQVSINNTCTSVLFRKWGSVAQSVGYLTTDPEVASWLPTRPHNFCVDKWSWNLCYSSPSVDSRMAVFSYW